MKYVLKLPETTPGSLGSARTGATKLWVAMGLLAAAQGQSAGYQVTGGDFPLVAAQAGDQITPALALGKTGQGYVVWSDNTDGSGWGIGAQAYSRNGIRTGQSFRVNATTEGDQTHPSVAVLADGSTFVAWQSGAEGAGAIYGRLIGSNGVLRDEVLISSADQDVRTVAVAASTSGGAIVVWSQNGADSSGFGILARTIGANGAPIGPARTVNSYSLGNQRGSSVAALANGEYAAIWTSEGQTGGENVDVVVRRITADGTPTGTEQVISRARSLNQYPTITGLPNGGAVAAWSTLNGLGAPTSGGTAAAQATTQLTQVVDDVKKVVWGVVVRNLAANLGPNGTETTVSEQENDSQIQPRIAVGSSAVVVSWSGAGLDSSGSGINARALDLDLKPLTSSLLINQHQKGDQDAPAIIADGDKSFLVTWSDWQGLNSGMDLLARRFQESEIGLAAPPAPIAEATSAWQVRATWAPVQGLSLLRYEVSFDDSSAAVSVTDAEVSSSDYLPATTHTIKYRYVLSDGQVSPYSASTTVTTWGKDGNADGLPDDWQAKYFGADVRLWPAPSADSDGDGVSNRDEFLAGTDPTNASDALKVRLTTGYNGPQVSWNAKPGATYRVQSTSDFSSWRDLTAPIFAAEVNQSAPVTSGEGAQYFRVLRIR